MRLNLVFLVIIICFSCQSEIVSYDTIKIKPSTNFIEASQILDNFEIIPLDSSEKALIGEITKIEKTEDIIYILDQKQEKLFLFSNTGEYLSSIQNVGRGPYEYLTLDDFIIYEDKLWLLSRASRKLFLFSLKGDFEKVINLKKQYVQMAVVQNNMLALFRDFTSISKSDFFNFEIFDLKSEKIIMQFSPFLKKQDGQMSWGVNRSVFSSNKDRLFASLPFQSKIFELKKEGMSTFLNIDFGSKNSLSEDVEGYTYDEIKKINDPLILDLNELSINDEYIHFSYIYNGLKQNVIINKEKNKVIACGYLVGDLKIPFDLTNKLILKNDKIITFFDPELFESKFYKKERISKIIESHGYLIKDLSKNNNPIIVIFNLKNGTDVNNL